MNEAHAADATSYDGGRGAVAAVRSAQSVRQAFAYMYAVVSNVTHDMGKWHRGIEARLLFLSLLHQVAWRATSPSPTRVTRPSRG